LQQLAATIGTNRTYLSNYFAQQGYTYNTYINRLRTDHFIRLYHKNINTPTQVTATLLAQQCGFRSCSYELIVSTLSGLYRYKTQKTLLVVGHHHDTPTVIIDKE